MILQALTEYYQTLADSHKISPYGWGMNKVHYALCIETDGTLKQVISVQVEGHKEQGKKLERKMEPQPMCLPAQVKRTSGRVANFLCDNSRYLLGIGKENNGTGESYLALEDFQVCKDLHQKLLNEIDSPAAQAVRAFFHKWRPEEAIGHPALSAIWNEIPQEAIFVFRHNNVFVQKDTLIQEAWNNYFEGGDEESKRVCLVTGKCGPVARIHPSIKKVGGTLSVGAALVSFNQDAFRSYGKGKKDYNVPVSKYAAFAYTTALNSLLSDEDHVYRMGDTTVVCWAKCGGDIYQNILGWACFGQEPSYTLVDMQGVLKKLCSGTVVELDENRIDPNMEFYILGLSPNVARISVRFFLRNSFGAFLRNARAHQQRLEMVKTHSEKFDTIPIWKLLAETVNQNIKVKRPIPNMEGEVLRAILNDTGYPTTLLNGVMLRVRAERNITHGRAAIIKAYYLKNRHPDVPKEVLTMALNPDSSNIPYNLGRLFSILEKVQAEANPGINSTIKNRYFNSASATPAVVFPTLLNLAQNHLKKLDIKKRSFFDKQIRDLLSKFDESYPNHMNLPQQGCFQLGYYHQTQKRFEKKEEK